MAFDFIKKLRGTTSVTFFNNSHYEVYVYVAFIYSCARLNNCIALLNRERDYATIPMFINVVGSLVFKEVLNH